MTAKLRWMITVRARETYSKPAEADLRCSLPEAQAVGTQEFGEVTGLPGTAPLRHCHTIIAVLNITLLCS